MRDHSDHIHHLERMTHSLNPNSEHYPLHPHKWIQSAIRHPGAFTKKAEAAGETPKEYMREVLAHPEKHDTRARRQANLMKTLLSFHH